MDWHDWYRDYDDPGSDLSRRLRSVQASLRAWLDRAGDGPLRIVSACAGDGRDLLEVLAGHPAAPRVTARLVELDDALAQRAEDVASAAGLDGVEVVRGDAGRTDSYAGMVPADLVLWCGVFGNLGDEDVRATIRTTRQLAAPGAHVVWTRGTCRGRDDVEPTDAIGAWFTDAEFELVSLDMPADTTYRVGVHRYGGRTEPLDPGRTFFAFVR
ncbi:class I SAM-dependent methyltransferase [Nocardioides iriomotensis]|uniref:Class I SAM-dependent methyltransferase n=1 Tax=Nocardioides iriomotensis TaxID=715784 RepID=A0A4Q5J183_9ACTN|nr:class I SAM-dependent methyltransferase [Nocardioides iriomotensis]RYU12287.1 class I SAM-dependent methyltransferase [Nocardioides iriomotensis]